MKSDSATNIKNNFSSYLDRVKRGEVVLVLEYGRPIAQISKPASLPASELSLASLEREGLVSRPEKEPLDPIKFLSNRLKLPKKASLLAALLKDREESV